jgi:hypothetical protein
MNIFSPTQSFSEQLQSAVDTSPTMDPFVFSGSPTFTFDPGNMDNGNMEGSGAVSGMYGDQFMVGSRGHLGDLMGMDMDDPILNSLQTLAEGKDFGEHMGEPQNFNVWEWFEQQ